MKPATLAEHWEERAAEQAKAPKFAKVPPAVQAKRDFMAGALAACALPRDQVLRECIDFARTIGRPEERATN